MNVLTTVFRGGKYQLWCTDDGKPHELMEWNGKTEAWVRMWHQSYKWRAGRPLGEGDRRTSVMAAFGYEWRIDAPEGSGWYWREYQGGDIILRRDTGNLSRPRE